jgi:hypothetical protein
MAGEFKVKNGLIVSGSTLISGSIIATSFTGSFSGSFSGVGASNIISTGSITASVNSSPDFFLIQSGSRELFKINTEGVIQLEFRQTTPTAVDGGIFYSSSGEFFFGI